MADSACRMPSKLITLDTLAGMDILGLLPAALFVISKEELALKAPCMEVAASKAGPEGLLTA
jgi:hypothetical protein